MMKPWEYGPLRVSDNKRYMQNGDQPFFWLGDTAWLLLCKCSIEEIDEYLTNRAQKGYNVIQITISHKWPTQTVDGRDAFLNENMCEPDLSEGGFWDTLDHTVKKCEELGMYAGLLPCWSGRYKSGNLTEDNVEQYTTFLAERYKEAPNIIWITGGDCKGTDGFDFWTKMGRTLKAHNPDKLVTFHPFGRTVTCDYFPDSEWIDFYMFQSGHRRYDQRSLKKWDDSATMGYYYGEDSFRYIERVENCGNVKPVLDGEPSYEHIPQGLHNPKEPFWQDYDVRRFAYWSVLAGGCGFTYGHGSIMQFYRGGDDPAAYGCSIPWKDAIHSPGCDNMSKMAALMRSLAWETGKAAQHMLGCEEGERYERISVFSGDDFTIFYTYTGREIVIKEQTLPCGCMKAYWVDPVSGAKSYITTVDTAKTLRFCPPVGTFSHTDWILLLQV